MAVRVRLADVQAHHEEAQDALDTICDKQAPTNDARSHRSISQSVRAKAMQGLALLPTSDESEPPRRHRQPLAVVRLAA